MQIEPSSIQHNLNLTKKRMGYRRSYKIEISWKKKKTWIKSSMC